MKNSRFTIGIIICAATAFLGYAFFIWTAVPYLQMADYYLLISNLSNRSESSEGLAFSPYTYVQPEIRNNFLYILFDQYKASQIESVELLLPVAIEKMEEVVRRNPHNSKYFLTLAEAYGLEATITAEKDYNLKEIETYKKALDLMPGNQRTAYGYALALKNAGAYDEAIRIMEETVKNSPNVEDSHKYLALILMSAGSEFYDRALDELDHLKDSSLSAPETRNAYLRLLGFYYKKKDQVHFLNVVLHLKTADPDQRDTYQKIEDYIREHKAIPNINISI